MPPPVSPCWIDTHQPIVAALIVFAGVVFGLIGNLLIGMVDRASKRKHEREAVRAILFAELTFLRETYEDRLRRLGEFERGTSENDAFIVTADPQTHHYHELMDKLGVLPAETLADVLPAYMAADHLPEDLRASEMHPRPTNLPEAFIIILRADTAHLRALFEGHAQRVRVAIEALRKVAARRNGVT